MANNWQLGMIAGLDGTQSRNQLNSDIKGLARNLDKLKLYTEIDKNQIIQLQNQLKKLQIDLNTVTVTDAAINGLVQKINDGLKNIQISNINVGNIGNQAQQVGQQIGNNIGQQITQSISSAIQKGTMKVKSADGIKDLSKYIPNGNLLQNDVAKQALKDFQALGVGIVTVKEEMKNIDGKNLLNGFTINIKNAKGEVESLRYALTDIEGKTGKMFQYVGGSINDNGVIQQMNTISAKADSLQTKLEKLKSSYSDMNASRPIKDSNNISALSQQYDKVAKSIENVRNADSASFSSMVSNAQREITVLENMVSQFRNAENVATQMKSVDISSGIAQAQERLGKLKANASGFDQMKQTIVELDTAIANVGDKSSLDAFINKLKVAESQLGRVKAETKQLQEANKIQLSYANGDYNAKVESTIAKTQQWVNANGEARISTTSLSTALSNLDKAYLAITADGGNTVANQKALKQAESELSAEIKKVTNDVTKMNATMAKSSAVDALRQKYQMFYDTNTAAHRKWGESLLSAISELAPGAEVSKQRIKELEQGLINTANAARQAGKLGLSFFDTIKQGMQKFSYWTSSTFLVMKTITSIKSAVSSVKELDTSLVDLKKTTSMTASQLEEFYYTANDVAKQMGVTTKEIIDQASAWSRLGYSSQEAATKMAKYSSMFASISPGMDVDTATDGLVSIMKAFDIGNDNPDDVLDGIMSKVNIIGNTAATSNAEIVNMLSKSSSAMKEANNTLEETIALETAAVEITRDDDSVGTAFKTLSMRIRGYDEETESYTNNVEELSGKIADLTKTASTPGGISLFTDASKTEFKSTYQLLSEISKVYDQLSDKNQAQLLEVLAGKRQGQIVAATINNFQAAEKAMDNMAKSAGNAEAEMSVIMDSLDYKLNRLKETFTGISQKLLQRDDMKAIVDAFTSIGEAVDFAVDKLGLFGTIGLGAGLFAGIKNVGQAKMWACLIYAYPC